MKRLIFILLILLLSVSSTAYADIIKGGGDVTYPVDGKAAIYDVRYRVPWVHLDITTGNQSYTITFPEGDVHQNGQVYIKASAISAAIKSKYGIDGDSVVRSFIRNGKVQARATIEIFRKSTGALLKDFQTEDQIDPVARVKYGFGEPHLAHMHMWFRDDIRDLIQIDIPQEINLVASNYQGPKNVLSSDKDVTVGCNITSTDNVNGVKVSVEVDGQITNFTKNIVKGTNFYGFKINISPQPTSKFIKITVNDKNNPNPTETSYDDNTVSGSLKVIDSIAPAPPSSGNLNIVVSLKEVPENAGWLSGNNIVPSMRTKSGYGIPSTVEIQGFNYRPVQNGDGSWTYYSDFKITSRPTVGMYIKTLQGAPQPFDSSGMELISHNGWGSNFGDRVKFMFARYGPMGKRQMYTKPNLADGNYYIDAIITASTSWKEHYKEWNPTAHWHAGYTSFDSDPPVSIPGYYEGDWEDKVRDRNENYTETARANLSIAGSMFDDDSIIITR